MLNNHLSSIQKTIWDSLRYKDEDKLEHYGGSEELNINFWIEIERNKFYTPI